MIVQVGGNRVTIQVQSSGLGAALALSRDMSAEVAAAAASADAAQDAETGAETAQAAAAASAAAAAATLAGAALKSANLSDMASPADARTNIGADLAANVNYTPAGGATYSNPQDVQTALRERVSLSGFKGATTLAQMQNAIAYAATVSGLGGVEIIMPPGQYTWASGTIAGGITLPSNTRINAHGAVITISGATVCYVFRCDDASNVGIVGGEWIGNSEATGVNNGSFFDYTLTTGAAADTFNVRIADMVLRNFKAERWISFQNQSTGGKRILGPTVERVIAFSQDGNSISTVSTANGAHVVVFDGFADAIVGGKVDHVIVDASYIKGAVGFFGEVTDSTMSNCVALNAGSNHSNDSGCYAFFMYDSSLNGLARCSAVSCRAISARDCGFYLAAGEELSLSDCHAPGQYSTAETTLPKGGIVSNGTYDLTMTNCTADDCYNGVSLIPNAADATHAEANNRLTNVIARNATSAAIRITPYGVISGGVHLSNCSFHAVSGGRAMLVPNNTGTNYIRDVTADDCDFLSDGNFGVSLNPLSVTTAATGYRFSNCRFQGANTCVDMSKLTGRVSFHNVEVLGSGGTAYGLLAQDATDIDVDGILVSGSFSAYGLYLSPCTGTLRGVRSATSSPLCIGLGIARPTHSGLVGQIVENQDPAATEYLGWVCVGTTTWKGFGTIEA